MLSVKMTVQIIKEKKLTFLTINYSAIDYVGHHFGIRSKELEDIYVRMDREIALLLNTLDKEVGKGNYTLFLTADHGASDNPFFLEQFKLPGSFYSPIKIKKALNTYLSTEFGETDYVAFIDKTQVYFNYTKTQKELVIKKAATFLKNIAGVKAVFTPNLAKRNSYKNRMQNLINNSFYLENSGDILMHFHSGWMVERPYGTTHGTIYTSDTHVPLLWYGNSIPKGETIKKHEITQIAPTLSMLLNIPLPNSSNRSPIEELFQIIRN